jgi:predicted metal-dependent hydrolase
MTDDGGRVLVTLPPWGRPSEAVRFAETRRGWLETQKASQVERCDPFASGWMPFRGCRLGVLLVPGEPRGVRQEQEQLLVSGPRDGASARLQRWLEMQCLVVSEADIARYCRKLAREPAPLRLSRARRRWGSCSAAGTIRINWRLVMAPDFVRRSVLAHEAAHLVHFDHSPAFHQLHARLLTERGEEEKEDGSPASARNWLTNNGRTLFAPFG